MHISDAYQFASIGRRTAEAKQPIAAGGRQAVLDETATANVSSAACRQWGLVQAVNKHDANYVRCANPKARENVARIL
jgi:hypothetical protein